ncbi:iron(III) transport system substrate-binding protein [Treponema rectale]|uniref:Iron(III) transport system substrate-binding protein n=1 Tax=Treponema rectale TaxID=744512 RepID=A0A840SHE8_9SPIR|nr:ABC transporter substrate-binding protein [Treponema rectale]MBB5218841.1 iron(III) transport system substrate-binding protein [Treponema rectale]
MKKNIWIVFACIFGFLLSSCAQEEELHIYSIIHEEETQALTDLFTKETGIKVSFLRATTGELVNRIIAERDDPQADILLGGATAYHMQAAEAGALEPYVSPLAKNIPEYALSPNGEYTGFCILTLGIGVNTKRYAQKFSSIPEPKTWEDLLNPAYKGEIVLTNPIASSTAYLFVQNQLQRLGWNKGWDYLLTLAPLVGQFPTSGSAPAKLIGTGEYALGVSYIHALAKYNADGFDVKVIAPPQSVGDVDCIAITKNTKNLEAAKKFVDFMLSPKAQELMSSIDFTLPVNPDATPAKGSVALSEIDLIDYDLDLAATQKNDVLERWAKEVK